MESGLGRIKKKSLPLMIAVDYGKSGSELLAESSELFLLVVAELRVDVTDFLSISS